MVRRTDKCQLCRNAIVGNRFNVIEFSSWNMGTWEDWKAERNWVICKDCKVDIRNFILEKRYKELRNR